MKGRRLAAFGGACWALLAVVLPWLPGVGLPGYHQAFVVGLLVPVLLAPVLMAAARTRSAALSTPLSTPTSSQGA